MAKKRRKHPLDVKSGRLTLPEAPVRTLGLDQLVGAIQSLLTIQGVEGIGQPVALLSPADLPPDVLGFVERLRGGCIEGDEEMLLITLAGSRRRRRGRKSVLERLREALMLLCRYAMDQGVTAGDLMALLDEAKCQVSRKTRGAHDEG
jgi:hypothetical protein